MSTNFRQFLTHPPLVNNCQTLTDPLKNYVNNPRTPPPQKKHNGSIHVESFLKKFTLRNAISNFKIYEFSLLPAFSSIKHLALYTLLALLNVFATILKGLC